MPNLYELYQAEWCPYSSRVREELTERGVDFIARQVAAEKDRRDEMRQRTGTDEIPVLVAGEQIFSELHDILAFLAEQHPQRPDAAQHRRKDTDPQEQQERQELLHKLP